jgi:predicted negative regulator of RcsB-dependent stress response
MKSSTTKKIVIIFFLGTLSVSAFLYFYVYKSHRNITTESVAFSISVIQLHQDFMNDSETNIKKYADKTIETYGKITSLDLENNAIVLDNKVFLKMTETISKDLTIQQTVKIKGRFVGFDDLLEELKMDQCIIVN